MDLRFNDTTSVKYDRNLNKNIYNFVLEFVAKELCFNGILT